MNRASLIADLTARLSDLLKGYSLPGKNNHLQEIKVFAQYVPQPAGITFENRDKTGLKNYAANDYESNFPCVIVKLEDMTDMEERARTHSLCNVRILIGIYDEKPECQGYIDVLNLQEVLRLYLLENRILANRHLLMMPLRCKLDETDTWPVYWGEMELTYQVGRPVRSADYVYRYDFPSASAMEAANSKQEV